MADEISERGTGEISKPDLFGDEFTSSIADVEATITEPTTEVEPGVRQPVTPQVVTKPPVSGDKVTRSVDLGDGSGKQVFTANSAEELLDVMTTAQENATRKIREQQFEIKRQQRAKPERPASTVSARKDLTADELFAIANDLKNDPAAAMDKIAKARTGRSFDEIGKFIDDFVTAQAINQADVTFLTNHPDDFVPNAANSTRMIKFLTDEKLPHTAANLEYAFQELTESGLLDEPAESVDATDKVSVQPHQRRRPMSTGVQNKHSSARPVDAAIEAKGAVSESDVEEIYKLPLEDARQKMLKLMAKARAASGV